MSALLDKVKAFWEKAKNGVIGILGLALVVVLWILNIKSHKEDALKAQIALADTKEKADALETQIKAEMAQAGADAAQIAKYQGMLNDLEKKRTEATLNMTAQQVEDYWKNHT